MVQFQLLPSPPPPGNPWDKSGPLGLWVRKIENNFSLFLYSTLFLGLASVEKIAAYFPEKSLEFVTN